MTATSQNNRRIVKNTVMLYIRMLLLMLVTLYTSRVVLRVLGVEDYGLYSIVGSIVIFLAFINISMATASQRFLSFYQGRGNEERLSSTFNSILVVQGIIALIVLVVGETVGVLYIEFFLNVDPSKLSAAHIVYQFSLFSIVAKTVTVPYHASIIANERMNVYAWLSIMEGLLQLAVVFILQRLTDNKLVMYALMMFMTVLIVQLCYRIYGTRHFKECKFRKNWDRGTIRDVFSYSGWSLMGSFSSMATDQGVNMVLNSFFGVVVNAARGIAFQVSGAVTSLSGNFQQALNPQIVKTYAEEERESMHGLIMNGTRFCFYLLLVLSVPVLFNMHALLALWLGEVPAYTEIFCKLILINSLIYALSNTLHTGAMATGNIKKYQIVIATINLLNIPLCIIGLYLWYNPYLTAYIMITLSVIGFIVRLILTSRMTGMSVASFLRRTMLPTTLVVILSVAIAFGVDHLIENHNIWTLILRIGVIFIVVVGMIATVGVTGNERQRAVNFVIRKIKRHS
jgi:O-antigen/teichoic acid export membrane protein